MFGWYFSLGQYFARMGLGKVMAPISSLASKTMVLPPNILSLSAESKINRVPADEGFI